MKIERSISAKFGKKLILKNFCECKLFASSAMNSPSDPQPCSGKQTEKRFQDMSRTVTPPPAAAGVSVALHCVWKTFQPKTKNSRCPVQLGGKHVLAAVVCQGAGVKASLQENRSEEEPRPHFGTITSRRYLNTICEWPAEFLSPVVGYTQSEWSSCKSSDRRWV